MPDSLLTAFTKDGFLRVFACDCSTAAETAREIHNLSVTASMALSRLLCGGFLLGATLKNKDDKLTLRIDGDGPLLGLLVNAKNDGRASGYVFNSRAELPLKDGHVNVSEAIGKGFFSVIRDVVGKHPYTGQVELIKGEIGEDLAYYFALSEQIPTAVSLGALVLPDATVKKAGGYILQLLPGAEEDYIAKLEHAVHYFPNFCDILDMGYSLEHIVTNMLLKDFALEITAHREISFGCDCSAERFFNGIKLLEKKELEELLSKNEPIETVCHFCGKKYTFSVDSLK